MNSALRVTVRRPLALGAAATLVATMTVAQAGAPAHAEESPLPGIQLPTPATDVTDTDSSLASTIREVVVVVEGADGLEVHKLRTRTHAEAADLAQELDSEPGVTAEANQTFTTPTVDSHATGRTKSAGSFDLSGTGSFRSSSVSAL